MLLKYAILYFCINFCLCDDELPQSIQENILNANHILSKNRRESGLANNNSIGFTLTKLLNIKLDGKYDTLIPTVQEVVHSQMMEESEARNRGIPQDVNFEAQMLETIKTEFGIVKDLLEHHNNCGSLEKYLESLINGKSATISRCDIGAEYNDICKSLVGVDKLPICQSLEKNRTVEQKNATKMVLPRNCKEVQENGATTSGLYEIQPKMSKKPFMVLCDMDTKGGGWTHIQKRVDGSEDFYRGWREYKHGFGNLEGEFWIGLENIYALTAFEVNELLIEIVDRDMVSAYAHYKAFSIGSEKEGYPLNVLRDFSGDAGDSLTEHLGSKFTTKDFDQDANPSNCAVLYDGAWWYKSCHISNLNGKYLNVDLPVQYKFHGLHWKTFRSHEYCHAKARMMVRPAQI